MLRLIKLFFKRQPFTAVIGIFIILVLVGAGIYISFLFLDWYKNFYDVLGKKDYSGFRKGIVSYGVLATIQVVINTILRFVNQNYTLSWRAAITEEILATWNNRDIEGYAQRIQEDCSRFSRLVEGLFVGILNAILSLIIFSPILIESSKYMFDTWGLLWFISLGFAIFGIALSFFLGKPLPRLEYENQKTEAALRSSLEFKRGNYIKLFSDVRANYKKLFNCYTIFNFFSTSFFNFGVVLPYIIIGKFYFTGVITLGILVQVSKTFNKVNDSMSYLVDNWTQITELQSVTLRLKEFYNNL